MEAAGGNKLQAWAYHDMIDRFAQKYSQHPDNIFKNTTFDTITAFLCKWNDEGNVQDAYNELERQMSEVPKP